MSPEARREMIVAAALPLLVEHGAAVGTLQIAKAAGIGEATIFRVFADKEELLEACVAAALRNDHVLTELDAVPLDQPLAARLTEAAASLHAYLHRMGAVIAAVHSAGRRGAAPPRRPGGAAAAATDGLGAVGSGAAGPGAGASGHGAAVSGRGGSVGREEAAERTLQAVVRLLEPDRAALRLPIEQLAAVFLGMLFSGRGAPIVDTPIETLVDIFLHGVVTPGAAS
ncbi:TetR family transcriptional regulator [Actinoplanes philippinensis]|uniref:Regulatory protein, tetR family n=2 Tax=Actinoplanes philippinensis TaxID=35752 RepID=A0A1I2GT05_9ACTN|nr:TetR family transcriptional regulator [Actinoplanes philippinensis]SFF20323.1 regulatory protein, tetR family [Actinoplanes philippinensis]